MREVIISEREEGQRLDRYLEKYMPDAPKSFFYKMMRKKNIVLNGKKVSGSERIQTGDQIKLFLADETIDGFRSGKKAQEVDLGAQHLSQAKRPTNGAQHLSQAKRPTNGARQMPQAKRPTNGAQQMPQAKRLEKGALVLRFDVNVLPYQQIQGQTLLVHQWFYPFHLPNKQLLMVYPKYWHRFLAALLRQCDTYLL